MKFKNALRPLLVKTRCKCCNAPIQNNSLFAVFSPKNSLCYKCFSLLKIELKTQQDQGIKYTFIYSYNDFLKEQLYLFKGCGDIELRDIFLEPFYLFLKIKYHGYLFVLAPSSKEDVRKRGFSHLKEMLSILNFDTFEGVYKKENFKQSSLKKQERTNIVNKLDIRNGEVITNRKIVIFDDVFTTGSTIKAIIKLVNKYRPKKIQVLTVAKVDKE